VREESGGETRARHSSISSLPSAMASGVWIVYALRIKDERRRHDVRLSRPHHWPRGAAYLPPPSAVTPHPVLLAERVDHDPHLAMVSGDYRSPPIVCLSYSLARADTPQSPHSDSKFITMFNPLYDANGC